MSVNSVLNIIIPFLTMPFTFLSLGIFIFVSFNRKKIKITSKFQFQIDRRNTEIKLMINTFMRILLVIEILHNSLVTVSYVLNYSISNSYIPNLWHTNCTIDNSDILTLLHKEGWILLSPVDISYSSATLLLSTLTLLLRVLKRRYINRPYKVIIKNTILFMSFRFLLLLTLFSTPYTYFIALVLKLTCVFDLSYYIYYSHSFYSLLKGRSIEAQWHSTARDFREKSRIETQYYYTCIFCIIIFSFFTAEHFLHCINGFLDIVLQNTCILSHFTFGYIPEITFDLLTQRILSIFITISSIVELTLGIFHQILTSLAYSIVFAAYAMYFYKNSCFPFNIYTRVCMQQYHNTIGTA